MTRGTRLVQKGIGWGLIVITTSFGENNTSKPMQAKYIMPSIPGLASLPNVAVTALVAAPYQTDDAEHGCDGKANEV